jgi:hypothetical protein
MAERLSLCSASFTYALPGLLAGLARLCRVTGKSLRVTYAGPEVRFEELATDLRQARFWLVSCLPTIGPVIPIRVRVLRQHRSKHACNNVSEFWVQ